jgi:hypothetical protein
MSLLLWDVRTAMEEESRKTLEGILNNPKNKKKDSYYILRTSNFTGNHSSVINTKYMLLDKKPPKMLGTVLWHVDNRNGKLKQEWMLPFDYRNTHDLVDIDNVDGSVMDSSQSLGLAISG